jgi:hypothetical protein
VEGTSPEILIFCELLGFRSGVTKALVLVALQTKSTAVKIASRTSFMWSQTAEMARTERDYDSLCMNNKDHSYTWRSTTLWHIKQVWAETDSV